MANWACSISQELALFELHCYIMLKAYPVMVTSPDLVIHVETPECPKTFHSNLQIRKVHHWSS